MRSDSYWREQQRLITKGEPLTPENQVGLAVWTEVKYCLHTVFTECLVWQQQRIRAWEKKQNPSLAEKLIAEQDVWLELQGFEAGNVPRVFDPDTERFASGFGFSTRTSTSHPKGKEPKGVSGLAEQACSTAQESEKADQPDFERSSEHDSDKDEPTSATQEITGLLPKAEVELPRNPGWRIPRRL